MADAYSTEIEIWKPVADDTRYEVSNMGRVRSCGHHTYRRILGGQISHGYRRVYIGRSGRSVHRLVLEAFVGPCPDGYECAHLDGTRLNNVVANLKWVTRTENMRHKNPHGTAPHGERCGASKLTAEQVCAMRKAYADGEWPKALKARFGIGGSEFYDIVSRRRWWYLGAEEHQPCAPTRATRPRCEHCRGFMPFVDIGKPLYRTCKRCGHHVQAIAAAIEEGSAQK